MNRKTVTEILPYIAELFTVGIITKDERNEFSRLLMQIPNAEAEMKFKERINGLARICPHRLIYAIRSLMNGEEEANVHLG